MIDEKDLREKGMAQYKSLFVTGLLPRNYVELAARADLVTETCLREMSKGTDGVIRDRLYGTVFEIVFRHLIENTLGGRR